jgi:F0F1-type ATP synthase assembly protein I
MPNDDADRNPRDDRDVRNTVESVGPAAAAAYTLVGAVLGLGGLGYAIDGWRGTSPWFLVGGLFLGMTVGFYELVKSTRRR